MEYPIEVKYLYDLPHLTISLHQCVEYRSDNNYNNKQAIIRYLSNAFSFKIIIVLKK